MAIANLSYTGDFRMNIGEDKNKVLNIVYAKEINKMSQFLWYRSNTNKFEQDVSPTGRHFHLSMLPKNMQVLLVKEWNRDKEWHDVEDVLRAAAVDRDLDEIITKCLEYIVAPKSISQAAKGIVTAGLLKSGKYATAKLQKMICSKAAQITDPVDMK